MKKLNHVIITGILLFAVLTLLLQACKKTDVSNSAISLKNKKKFFEVPELSPGTIKKIAAYIKGQNIQYNFLNNLIK
jgi:hypothetical protein